jgi:hypothetical protein
LHHRGRDLLKPGADPGELVGVVIDRERASPLTVSRIWWLPERLNHNIINWVLTIIRTKVEPVQDEGAAIDLDAIAAILKISER